MIIFNMKGTRIRLCFGFFAAVMLYFYITGRDRLCFTAAFISCILHECGHLTAMLLFRCPPDEICFYFGGIRIKPSYTYTSRGRMTIILLAGCVVNFTVCAISKLLHLEDMAFINLTMGVFNLMPFRALDGGHILALYSSERITRAVSLIVLSLFFILPFMVHDINLMSFFVIILFAFSEFLL